MPKFNCKHCGMITDNPEIVPHPAFNEAYWASEPLTRTPFNYSITCPVCLNETRFWRDEPFPADKEPTEMKQERCDDEHCFLPKGHEGLHQAKATITFKNNNIDLSSIPTRVI